LLLFYLVRLGFGRGFGAKLGGEVGEGVFAGFAVAATAAAGIFKVGHVIHLLEASFSPAV
jgi:hypothetical protein